MHVEKDLDQHQYCKSEETSSESFHYLTHLLRAQEPILCKCTFRLKLADAHVGITRHQSYAENRNSKFLQHAIRTKWVSYDVGMDIPICVKQYHVCKDKNKVCHYIEFQIVFANRTFVVCIFHVRQHALIQFILLRFLGVKGIIVFASSFYRFIVLL